MTSLPPRQDVLGLLRPADAREPARPLRATFPRPTCSSGASRASSTRCPASAARRASRTRTRTRRSTPSPRSPTSRSSARVAGSLAVDGAAAAAHLLQREHRRRRLLPRAWRSSRTSRSAPHVLEIYYLCLCLGFQGQYAVRGGEGLGPVIDQLGSRLGSSLGNTDVISPHGEPREAFRGLMRREMPLVGPEHRLLRCSLSSSSSCSSWCSQAASPVRSQDMTKGSAPAAAQAAPGTR